MAGMYRATEGVSDVLSFAGKYVIYTVNCQCCGLTNGLQRPVLSNVVY